LPKFTRHRLTATVMIAGLALTPSCTASNSSTNRVVEPIVTGSTLHTINGLALAPDGRILAAGLGSETISEINPKTGKVSEVVAQPDGRSDDLVVTPSGDILWTDPLAGSVKRRDSDGHTRTVAQDLPGVNSIAFDRSGQHLYVGQTFFADGLWEIDPGGAVPPRLVARDIGGLNAFAFGSDGMIYGPIGKRDEVVRIDPGSGAAVTLAAGFRQPVSVRFDTRDQLYVLDGATGELIRVDPTTGEKVTVAVVPAAADNMVIGPTDHAYVSNMADSSVLEVDLADGNTRTLTQSPLAYPRDIAVEDGTIYVADSTALRTVDPADGTVTEIARRLSSELEFPSGISASREHLVLTSELVGTVQVLDRTTGQPIHEFHGFDRPADAVELADGSLVISEPSRGRLLRVFGEDRRPYAENLGTPTGLAVTEEGDVLVTDTAGGRLLKIGATTQTVTQVASDLGAPRAIAIAPDGSLAVVDTAAGRVLSVDPLTDEHQLLAQDLAVGYLTQPYGRSGGLAIGSDGTIFVSADRENSVYAIRRP
jgi:sugar lactone lactonase YvrE